MISLIILLSSLLLQSNQSYDRIITMVVCISIILTLCWLVLYRLGKINKEKFKIEPRVWAGIFFGLLTVVVFIVHITFNTIKSDVQLINLIIIPILVGIITSLFAPLVQSFFSVSNIDIKFLSSVPCEIYPPSEKEPEGDSKFKTALVNSMRESNTYCYMGVDMTVASQCLDKVFKDKNNHEIANMLFIVSDPNSKDGELDNIKTRKYIDKGKLIESIKKINHVCSTAKYRIKAVFYILPNRPPLHIHKTDDLCFWGVVDKTGKFQCPTTYCYRKDDGDLSMFKTIGDLIEQTTQRVKDSALPSKEFEIISWNGKGKNNKQSNKITFKHNGKSKTISIDDFVDGMKIEDKNQNEK